MVRFLRLIEKGPRCWIFGKAYDQDGYGVFTPKHGTTDKAHRWFWKQKKGPIPKGLMVLHKCDNPPCIRIAHLFLGTALDNSKDCFKKGRKPILRGEEVGNSKLKASQVIAMRHLRNSGWTQQRIADLYKTCRANVSLLTRGINWRHL